MLVSGQLDTKYLTRASDIRVYLLSGVGVVGDGTLGGGPITGINYGIPQTGIKSITSPISGIVDSTLNQMMQTFPTYSRVSWDEASVGAQLLASVARLSNQLLEQKNLLNLKQFISTYPCDEQGVVYEWDFGDTDNLDIYPAVRARLGSTWFDLPLTKDENLFWLAPPTRLETTNCEISGFNLTSFQPITKSGLYTVNYSGILPIKNNLYIELSGIEQVSFNWDAENPDRYSIGYAEIRGYWANDNLRNDRPRTERIAIVGNGTYVTQSVWREITQVNLFNVDPKAYIKLRCLDFNNRFRTDDMSIDYYNERQSIPHGIIYQRLSQNTALSGLLRTTNSISLGTNDEFWLAKCWVRDEFYGQKDIEFDIRNFLRITQKDGTPISGIIDFTHIPYTKYLLALDRYNNCYVFDTHQPGLDMSQFPETTESPARIEATYPMGTWETPSNFTVQLDSFAINVKRGIQRYQWAVNHHGVWKLLDSTGAEHPYIGIDSWSSMAGLEYDIPAIRYQVSGTGQYTFQLSTVTDDGVQHRTFTAIIVPERPIINKLPINGLSHSVSGIDIDSFGRPWVSDGVTAVRLVMRNDIGQWLIDQKALVTRENYDEVRI